MLAPHDRENTQFDKIWISTKQLPDARIFVPRQAVRANDLRRDRRVPAHQDSASSRLWNMARPEVEPSSGSQARSGCGIRPRILRFSLRMPAILRAEPLGFWPSA